MTGILRLDFSTTGCLMPILQDQRFVSQNQTIRGTPEFFYFLSSETGCQAIFSAESDFDAEIRVEGDEVLVHPVQMVGDVERELKNQWHEYEFFRTMRLKLLSERTPQSWVLQFSIAKASLIFFHRSTIIRDARLVDLIVDKNGEVIAFGCVDSLSVAREMIDSLLSHHLPPFTPQYEGSYKDGITSEISDSNANLIGTIVPHLPGTAHEFIPSPPNIIVPSVPSERPVEVVESANASNSLTQVEGGRCTSKREKLVFMVRSIDAPRLIGSRGVNKRRIEETTMCTITLHTETKKDGEFPVEICGSTMEKCVAAREHIKAFLNEELKEEEEKKLKERPKIHLAISPRKPIRTSTGGTAQ